MEIDIIIAIIIGIIIDIILTIIIITVESKEEKQKELHQERDHLKLQLKPLTAEQIEDIHSRGKITPAEMLKEWEDMNLCAPGDGGGSAAWRCRKFGNCHDCLIDYVNQHSEYESFFKYLKVRRPINLTEE